MSDSKVSVTITNRAPGIQPPVYVAGNYSDPQWVPEPMEYTTSDDGVHTFTKTLQVEPGSKIVYKFRIGEGDWWLLNEDAPTVTDDAGNQNNVLEAPKATVPKEPAGSEEAAAEPVQTDSAQSTENPAEHLPHDTDEHSEIVQPQPVSQVDALKQSNQVDPTRTSTPEFIKTITEVSESAALLDRSTPEPGVPETSVGKDEEQASATLRPNAADTAAEVADSAALLDHPTPEPERAVDTLHHDKEAPSEVAAQVADTAATLDTEDGKETPSEVAAQVSDAAANLDSKEPEAHSKAAQPTYKTLADVKDDMKDESLEIAGLSNDHVPLFAHECAGLYEDDEIPGADDQAEILSQILSSGRPYEGDKEDYNDPTLEKFPSTRDEIISAVRKVETGLNADQVSVESVPLSPVVNAKGSPTAEARSEPRLSDTSPSSYGQQNLSLPPSLTAKQERSRSTTSLQSIDEGAEGAESAEGDKPTEPKSEFIADVVEDSNGVGDTNGIATKNGVETSEKSTVNEIAPLVEQAETADDVIEVAKGVDGNQGTPNEDAVSKTEAASQSKGADAEVNVSAHKPTLASVVTVPSPSVKPSTGFLSPVSDDDEAVVVRNTKRDEEPSKSGYLTPERAATPQPEEPGSPREPAPNTADPVAESDSNFPVLEAGVEHPASASRSPQIVVSRPEETGPDEELLPAAALEERLYENGPADQQSESLKEEAPVTEGTDQSSKGLESSNHNETSGNVEELPVSEAPLDRDSSKSIETSNGREAPVTGNGSSEEGPHNENTATTSATEESQVPTLKKRSVTRPDPANRTGTPISITNSHKEAAKGGNWFSAFLRLIFVDFFGGIVRKITGGGRKTLVTTAIVLAAVGYAAFGRATETQDQVVAY